MWHIYIMYIYACAVVVVGVHSAQFVFGQINGTPKSLRNNRSQHHTQLLAETSTHALYLHLS